MVEPAPGELRYKAFLSYSHKDAAIAARLHRKLEAYRMPKRLVGRATPRGPVPARLAPIFRDREEMAASTDLSETVRAALAESGALIVLCSPDAAASMWVAEEIATFRALHPGAPVLAAIVAGTPPDCFPEPLRTRGPDGAWHEPLATDLRRSGDGRHLGLLKLVAGLTGVGLDNLVQRDAHRRIRRVTAITVAALAAMLIMAALTAVALGARQEADRQRAEAEGLIEFMLTDLRDRLKGVGRLDALTAVNERALRYYGSRSDLAELSDESLARRARILQAIGDDEIDGHDFDAAMLAFHEAYQTTVEQLSRAPNDPRRIFEHSKSDLGIGRVYESRDDWPAAQRRFEAFATAARRLVAIGPNNPDYMLKAASSEVELGNFHLKGSRDYQSAQRSYSTAVEWFGRAGRARPDNLHVLLGQANAYGWLADSFYVRRMWRESLDARLRQYEVVEGLRDDHPRNADVAFRLAAARRGVAHSYFRLGERSEARTYLAQASMGADCLVRVEPGNAEWQMLRRMLLADFQTMNLARPVGSTRARLAGRLGASADECDQAELQNTPREIVGSADRR
jgi:tetratricopeptide (TPR) repeat protein